MEREKWIAVLGRQDRPTDGVEDYCGCLGSALAQRGIELERERVAWDGEGWTGVLRELRRKSEAWRGRWVLLQYTALSWSRRGFPFRVVVVARILANAGARVAVVFHEPGCQGGTRWIDRLRGICQVWVIHQLYRGADRAIFTVPVNTVEWLPRRAAKAAFIPIGANIPERVSRRSMSADVGQARTVVVFGVTGEPRTDSEIEDIAGAMRGASKSIAKLRLVVIGRGAPEAQARLANALEESGVELVVHGILPAEEIAGEFERADALLFVRGAITPRRGSALAGVACGLPIVGYRNGDISEPLKEAGVEWAPWRDREALTRGLVRVLSDSAHWMELRERNLEAHERHFAWGRIAERYRTVLAR